MSVSRGRPRAEGRSRRQKWLHHKPLGIHRIAFISQALAPILTPSDFGPDHRALLRIDPILRNHNWLKSLSLFFSRTLRRIMPTPGLCRVGVDVFASRKEVPSVGIKPEALSDYRFGLRGDGSQLRHRPRCWHQRCFISRPISVSPDRRKSKTPKLRYSHV